jgi:hypothetical protein
LRLSPIGSRLGLIASSFELLHVLPGFRQQGILPTNDVLAGFRVEAEGNIA